MNIALKEAKKAAKKGEVPVGAVIVYKNKVIAKAYNRRKKCDSVISHAEVNAILKAAKKLKDWRLDGCDLFVTLKPCSMCENIIRESRICNVYYILDKPESKKEFNKTKYTQTNVCDEYKEILQSFFKNRR